MMGKLIIDNRSRVSDLMALSVCSYVVKRGRVSGTREKKQYCYATKIAMSGGTVLVVYAELNKKSDKLTVTDGYEVPKEKE